MKRSFRFNMMDNNFENKIYINKEIFNHYER